MNLTITDFFHKKWTIKGITLQTVDIIFIFAVTALGLYARYKLFPFQSEDYIQNLQHWYNYIADNGGIFALKNLVGNYTPPYTYLLALLTYLPFSSLTSIKLLSTLCDLLLAIIVALTVYKLTKSINKSIVSYLFTFMAPTVIVNSALWAQCDSVIMLFIALCVYYFVSNKPVAACITFGIALSIKIQSIFIAPVFLLLWLHGRVKLKHLLFIPFIYMVSVIPTALLGGSYIDALSVVYFQVSTTATALTFNCANMWASLQSVNPVILGQFGTLFAISITFVCIYMLIKRTKKITNDIILLSFLFFSLLIPFILPYMHERYYYYAEVLAIIYACINPKRFYVPFVIMFVSIFSYLPFLFNVEPISLVTLSILILSLLILLIYDLYYLTTNPSFSKGK